MAINPTTGQLRRGQPVAAPATDVGSPARVQAPVTFKGELRKGLRRGLGELASTGQEALAAGQAALGAEEAARANLEEAEQRRQRIAPTTAPAVGRVEDIRTKEGFGAFLEDATAYGAQLVGSQAPILGALAVGGAAGAGVARRMGGRAATGATVGVGAGSTGIETGSIFGDIAGDPEARGTLREQALVSGAGGLLAGSLDALPVFQGLKRLGVADPIRRSVVSRAARAAIPQAGSEAVTEAAQTLVERGTHKFMNENFELLGEEGASELLNAAVGGAVLGGGIGAVTGALQRPGATEDDLVAEEESQEALNRLKLERRIEVLRQGGTVDPQLLDDWQNEPVVDDALLDEVDSYTPAEVLQARSLEREDYYAKLSKEQPFQALALIRDGMADGTASPRDLQIGLSAVRDLLMAGSGKEQSLPEELNETWGTHLTRREAGFGVNLLRQALRTQDSDLGRLVRERDQLSEALGEMEATLPAFRRLSAEQLQQAVASGEISAQEARQFLGQVDARRQATEQLQSYDEQIQREGANEFAQVARDFIGDVIDQAEDFLAVQAESARTDEEFNRLDQDALNLRELAADIDLRELGTRREAASGFAEKDQFSLDSIDRETQLPTGFNKPAGFSGNITSSKGGFFVSPETAQARRDMRGEGPPDTPFISIEERIATEQANDPTSEFEAIPARVLLEAEAARLFGLDAEGEVQRQQWLLEKAQEHAAQYGGVADSSEPLAAFDGEYALRRVQTPDRIGDQFALNEFHMSARQPREQITQRAQENLALDRIQDPEKRAAAKKAFEARKTPERLKTQIVRRVKGERDNAQGAAFKPVRRFQTRGKGNMWTNEILVDVETPIKGELKMMTRAVNLSMMTKVMVRQLKNMRGEDTFGKTWENLEVTPKEIAEGFALGMAALRDVRRADGSFVKVEFHGERAQAEEALEQFNPKVFGAKLFPKETKDVEVIVGPITAKIKKPRKDGSIATSFKRVLDKNGNIAKRKEPTEPGDREVIYFDVERILKDFEKQPWRNPTLEGVKPLDRDFATPQQWAEFILAHEKAHVKWRQGKIKGVITEPQAAYENRVNQAALEELDRVGFTEEVGPVAVKYLDGVKAVKEAAARGEGISVLRGEGEQHFGNPFSHLSNARDTRKTENLKDSVDQYVAWLNGEAHTDYKQSRRTWVLEQIDRGELNTKPLLYYSKQQPNHAEALKAFINNRVGSSKEAETKQVDEAIPDDTVIMTNRRGEPQLRFGDIKGFLGENVAKGGDFGAFVESLGERPGHRAKNKKGAPRARDAAAQEAAQLMQALDQGIARSDAPAELGVSRQVQTRELSVDEKAFIRRRLKAIGSFLQEYSKHQGTFNDIVAHLHPNTQLFPREHLPPLDATKLGKASFLSFEQQPVRDSDKPLADLIEDLTTPEPSEGTFFDEEGRPERLAGEAAPRQAREAEPGEEKAIREGSDTSVPPTQRRTGPIGGVQFVEEAEPEVVEAAPDPNLADEMGELVMDKVEDAVVSNAQFAEEFEALKKQGRKWEKQLKLDGYRLINTVSAVRILTKRGDSTRLREIADGNLLGMAIGESVWVSPFVDPATQKELLAHEMGHAIAHGTAPSNDQQVFDAWAKWREETKGKATPAEARRTMRLAFRDMGSNSERTMDELSEQDLDYVLDFEEWFADEVAGWLLTDRKAVGSVERWTKLVTDMVKQLFGDAKKDGAVTDRVVEDFLTTTFKNDAHISGVIRQQGIRDARIPAAIVADDVTSHYANRAVMALIKGHWLTGDAAAALGKAFAVDSALNTQIQRILKPYSRSEAALVSRDWRKAAAYGYQFWSEGRIKVGPKSQDAAQKLKDNIFLALGEVGDYAQMRQVLPQVREEIARLQAISTDSPFDAVALLKHEQAMPRVYAVDKVLRDTRLQRIAQANKDMWGRYFSHLAARIFLPAIERMESSGNPALVELGRRFDTRPGVSGKQESYLQARSGQIGEWQDALARALGEKSSKETLDAVTEWMQGGELGSPPEQIAGIVSDLRTVFASMFRYGQAAGLDIKSRQNYFPWVYDIEQLTLRRDEFIEFLQRPEYAKRMEDIAKEAEIPVEDVAQELYNKITNDEGYADTRLQVGKTGHIPFMAALNERQLDFLQALGTPEGKEILSSFFSKDLNQILRVYSEQLVKRAEFARRFNPYKDQNGVWRSEVDDLMSQARELGATHDDLKLAEDFVAAAQGTLGLRTNQMLTKMTTGDDATPGQVINPKLQSAFSSIMLWQNFRVLSLAAFTSLADPVGIVVRGGSVDVAFAAMKAAFNQSYAQEVAQQLGVIDTYTIDQALSSAYGTNFMTGRTRLWNERFFHWTGLSALTRVSRQAAVGGAMEFLKRHKANVDKKHSKRWLAELNLEAKDIKLDANGEVLVLSRAEIEGLQAQQNEVEVDRDARVRAAIRRFVDESILRPNAATRPAWGSDPHFQLIFHLKSFMFTFHSTILRRVTKEAEAGNYLPAAYLMVFIPAMIGADFLRDIARFGLGGDPRKENWGILDYIENGSVRAGLPGLGLILEDAMQDREFGGTGFESFLGPTFGSAAQIDNLVLGPGNWNALVDQLPGQNTVLAVPLR